MNKNSGGYGMKKKTLIVFPTKESRPPGWPPGSKDYAFLKRSSPFLSCFPFTLYFGLFYFFISTE